MRYKSEGNFITFELDLRMGKTRRGNQKQREAGKTGQRKQPHHRKNVEVIVITEVKDKEVEVVFEKTKDRQKLGGRTEGSAINMEPRTLNDKEQWKDQVCSV